jgi:ABC-type dipeptide/oligopeptide/nickel transport system ATPase component
MKSFPDSIDLSTRRKRRKAMALVIELLEKIRITEESYMEKFPLNLRSGKAITRLMSVLMQ